MFEPEMKEFLILRELDDPITVEELEAVDERSTEVRQQLREEGIGVVSVKSDIMKNEDGDVTGTHCHYQAESEEAIREHADRAGLSISRIDRRGQPVVGDEF